MKVVEILASLEIVKPIKSEKDHAKTISNIFGLMSELKSEIVFIETVSQKFHLGREGSHNWHNRDWQYSNEGKAMPGEKITCKTKKGSYSITLPVNTGVYYSFCNLVGKEVNQETVKPEFGLSFEGKVLSELKTALTFVKNDLLRPAMSSVMVNVSNNEIDFVATDGYKIFQSDKMQFESMDIQFLLPIAELKKACQVNSKKMFIELQKVDGNVASGKINGISFVHPEDKFPNYKGVTPNYKTFIECDRSKFVNAIKLVLPYANKTTKQLRVNFNGCIAISGEDIDFANEMNIKIPYLNKDVKDFEIGFNGNYLLDCLKAVKSKTVKIFTEGNPDKAIRLDQKCLLMPVMLNQYI